MSAPAPVDPTTASSSAPVAGEMLNSGPVRSAPPQARCLAVLLFRSTCSRPSGSLRRSAIAVWWKSPSARLAQRAWKSHTAASRAE